MAKKAEVIITCDATTVKKVLEGINNEIEKTKRRRQELQEKQRTSIGLTKQEEKELQGLIKYENALNERIPKITGEMKKYGEVMKDLAGSKTKDLKKALREVKQSLDNMSAKDPKRQQLVNDLKKIQAQIDANTGALKRQQGAFGALGTTMKNLFAYAGIFAGFNMLKTKMMEAYEANKRFSDSLANVRKVSGLAMDDIKQLANNLSAVDSRTSLGGLMELSYTGAKLGFGNYGIEGLESFAKSAVKVQNALSEDMGEESMTALSKLVEVMGLIPKMGVERAMDAAGSAIFKLASTSTATGTNIIEFTKRLMGLANVSHVATSELLALGSASDSMGLMAEVSATAFNKVFTSIQSNTRGIEQALKFTKGELVDLINQGRTMDAIVAVFEKMHGMSMDQLKAQGVFTALGSDGARLNNVMITMANRIDMLREHLMTSNMAFEKGTAVAQEYAIQMDTAAAYSERAANIWEKAFVNPQGVDTVKEFTKAWYDVSKSMTSNKVVMGEIKFLLLGVLEVMKAIVQLLPSILYGLTAMGGYRLGAAIVTGLAPAWTAIKGMTLSVAALRTGFMALSTVARANIFGAAITAVFALVSAMGMLNNKIKEASGYMEGFKSDLGDLNTEYGRAEGELRRYRKAIDEANVGSKQRAAAIAQFNQKFKPYLSNLLTEKSTALDVAKAYQEVCKQIRTKLALQLKEKDIQNQVVPREQWTADRREEYDQRVREAGMGQYGSTWITGYAQDNATKSIDAMVREIGKKYYNLPDQVIKEIAAQANAGNREFNNYGNIINSRYLKQANALLAANSYLRQDRSATNALRRVNQKWQPEQDAMDAMLAAQNQPEPITPIDETRLSKEELKALKKEQQEARAAARKELKDAETETNAIIAKVEEWYTLQQNVVTQAYNDGELTEQQMTNINQQLEAVKNQALAAARRSLSGQDTQTWEAFKAQMHTLMLDQSEWSQELLTEINNTSMKALRDALMKFDGKKSLDQWGFSSTAFRDGLNKNAAKNEAKVKEIAAKFSKQAEKMLEQFQYVDVAQKKMQADLETLGFVTETYEQMAERLQKGIEKKPDTVLRLNASQQQSRQQMVDRFNATQGIGSQRPEDMGEWIKDFTDNGNAEWAKTLPEMQKWVKDTDKYKDQINNLYDLLKQLQRGQAIQMTAEQLQPTRNEIDQTIGTHISDREAYQQMGNRFISQGVISFKYNIENDEEARQWVHQFATDAKGDLEGWAQAFPQLVEWIDLIKRKEQGETLGEAEQKALEQAMPQIRNLYYEMMNHADRVNKAMKDAYQHEKTMQETRFRVAGYTDQEQRIDQQIDMQGKMKATGVGQTLSEQLGLDKIADDPEILQIQNRIYWRNLEFEDAKARLEQKKALQQEEMQALIDRNASEQEIENLRIQQMQDRAGLEELMKERQTALIQESMNLTTQVAQQMQKRVDAIKNFVKPVTDFTQAAGRKIGDMIFNMESEEATWEELWKNMALAVGEAVIEMGAQYLQNYIMQQSINRASEAEAISDATIKTTAGIAAGSAKTIGELGWWGIPLVAVISALLMGLLQSALSTKKSTDTSSTTSSSTPKTKLVSGMLTYDRGNVGTVLGGSAAEGSATVPSRSRQGKSNRRLLLDDGTVQVYDRERRHPVVGQDGQVYMVTDQERLPTGLITTPTATTVNGQAAIVGERGPEIVIGRETTEAIMMNEPRLLQHIIDLDRHHSGARTYDSGNVQTALGAADAATVPDGSPSSNSDTTLAQLSAVVATLSDTVLRLQRDGIPAHIRKYGTGGLIDEVQSGLKFVNRYKG